MELIQFNKNGGPVTIDVVINGAKIWSYEYVGDVIIKNNSRKNDDSKHMLSLPVDLENDINSWDIRFGNISDDSFTASATINWRQDELLLKTWTKQVLVSGVSLAKISDDALLIADILQEVV
jgi:hypothetical protein